MNNSNDDVPQTNTSLPIFKSADLNRVSKYKNKSFLKTVSDSFGEFSRNTSIHGFKYLGARRGCTLEKIWWIVVLGGCIYLCAQLTITTLKKREENPVFISFGQSPMHIWDIPFPAITICPSVKINPSKYNFTYYESQCAKNNLTAEELQHFMDVTMFCRKNKNCESTLQTEEHRPDHTSVDYLIESALSLNDILVFCTMNVKHFLCNESFSPILTTSGLCFSLNMLDRSELFQNITYVPDNHIKHRRIRNWSVDKNYIRTLKSTVPVRFTKYTDSIYFRLQLPQTGKICEEYRGFKIIMHHPADLPGIIKRYLLLSDGASYKIWIKPHITTTSSNLEDYYPHKRGCFFAYERKLKFFKIYTEENCKLECISNFTTSRCGCALFHTPHTSSTRVCGKADKSCVLRVKDEFLSMEMKLEVYENDKNFKYLEEICDCLPSCTSIVYNAEVSPEHALGASNNNGTSYTTVHMTFKDFSFVTMERNELFSNADFWASCGGLLGLFTGFSVVSLAEIIYFFTLKWICSLRNMDTRM